MYILPRTKLGKISIWLGLAGLATIVLLNVISQNVNCGLCAEGYIKDGNLCQPKCRLDTPACDWPTVETYCSLRETSPWRYVDIVLGLSSLAAILAAGVMVIISIVKQRERAIIFFIPLLLGLFALLFILGEIFTEH